MVNIVKKESSPSKELRWGSSTSPLNTYDPGDTVEITCLLEEATSYIEWGVYHVYTEPEDVVWSITVTGPDNIPYFFDSDPLNNQIGYITLDPRALCGEMRWTD